MRNIWKKRGEKRELFLDTLSESETIIAFLQLRTIVPVPRAVAHVHVHTANSHAAHHQCDAFSKIYPNEDIKATVTGKIIKVFNNFFLNSHAYCMQCM